MEFKSSLGPNSISYDKGGLGWAVNPASGQREAVHYLQSAAPRGTDAEMTDGSYNPAPLQQFGFASDFDNAGLTGYGQAKMGVHEGEFGDWLIPALVMGGMGAGALSAFGGAGALGGAEAFGGGAPIGEAAWGAGSGLDAIGQMVSQVPEGMTATEFAATQGYPTADAWLASMGGGAAGGAGATMLNPNSSGGSEMFGGDAPSTGGTEMFGDVPNAGLVSTGGTEMFGGGQAAKPNILQMLSSAFGGSGGLLGKAATALGLPAEYTGLVGPAYNIGSGIYGMYQGEEQKKRAMELAAQADPMGPYRAGYAQQLQQLMSNPSMISSLPGYKAGLQAVERRGAAQGWNGSGNMAASLSEFGGNFYDQQVQRLASLAGGNPGNAASLAMNGTQAGNSIAMQGLNRIGYGATQRDPTSDIIMRLITGSK